MKSWLTGTYHSVEYNSYDFASLLNKKPMQDETSWLQQLPTTLQKFLHWVHFSGLLFRHANWKTRQRICQTSVKHCNCKWFRKLWRTVSHKWKRNLWIWEQMPHCSILSSSVAYWIKVIPIRQNFLCYYTINTGLIWCIVLASQDYATVHIMTCFKCNHCCRASLSHGLTNITLIWGGGSGRDILCGISIAFYLEI